MKSKVRVERAGSLRCFHMFLQYKHMLKVMVMTPQNGRCKPEEFYIVRTFRPFHHR